MSNTWDDLDPSLNELPGSEETEKLLNSSRSTPTPLRASDSEHASGGGGYKTTNTANRKIMSNGANGGVGDFLRRHPSLRRVDVTELLERPKVDIPWRVKNFVRDGSLTMVTGEGGDGKSAVSLALAAGVARGAPAAGLDCKRGRSLIIDGENGEYTYKDRLEAMGIGAEVELLEANGFSLAWRTMGIDGC
jgi:hypothetical protein